eukprot:2190894-Alexandrium_andersonii.AAC.1
MGLPESDHQHFEKLVNHQTTKDPLAPTPCPWPRTPSTSTPSRLLPPSAVRDSGRAPRGSRLG